MCKEAPDSSCQQMFEEVQKQTQSLFEALDKITPYFIIRGKYHLAPALMMFWYHAKSQEVA